ncbi:MAG: ABC transporter ATP-binding protein, partial [Evtepia sp.]
MEYLAEVYHLCKAYPNFSLEDINLTVPCGSIVGLIGENGAGKTTTLKALSGVIRPDGGELRLLEQGASKKTREQVAVVWEDSYFDGILCPAQISKVMSGICSIWDAPLFSSYCKRFALAEKQQLKTFSRGMRMKLSLATALARHPLLLILDEATGGLDPVVRGEILDLFLEFIQDEQHGILLSSHITSDLEKIADEIAYIHNGKLLFQKGKDELLESMLILRTSNAVLDTLPTELILARQSNSLGAAALVTEPDRVRKLVPTGIFDSVGL